MVKATKAMLEAENAALRAEIQALKAELAASQPKHNARNAGRKKKVTSAIASEAKRHRKEGLSQRAIAESLGISVGTVNRILKEY